MTNKMNVRGLVDIGPLNKETIQKYLNSILSESYIKEFLYKLMNIDNFDKFTLLLIPEIKLDSINDSGLNAVPLSLKNKYKYVYDLIIAALALECITVDYLYDYIDTYVVASTSDLESMYNDMISMYNDMISMLEALVVFEYKLNVNYVTRPKPEKEIKLVNKIVNLKFGFKNEFKDQSNIDAQFELIRNEDDDNKILNLMEYIDPTIKTIDPAFFLRLNEKESKLDKYLDALSLIYKNDWDQYSEIVSDLNTSIYNIDGVAFNIKDNYPKNKRYSILDSVLSTPEPPEEPELIPLIPEVEYTEGRISLIKYIDKIYNRFNNIL